MHEIRMWKWEYTDEAGRRQVSRWLMTEREALRYKDAVRLQHTFEVIYDNARGAGALPRAALNRASSGGAARRASTTVRPD
jgi:hypothetical protein